MTTTSPPAGVRLLMIAAHLAVARTCNGPPGAGAVPGCNASSVDETEFFALK